MFKEVFSSSSYVVLFIIILLAELVLSAPQGYNYYANQQRSYYAQRAAQAQRIQAQRLAAQNRYYHQQSYRTTTTRRPYKVSKADSENAKFLGSQNQESVGSEKTFKKKAKKLFGAGYGPGYGGGYGPGVGNGCYFRNANQPKSEGRVFWDFNVYNVYPNGGCGGGGGYPGAGGYPGGFGGIGGGLADPIYGGRPVRGFFQNWLGLFLPGGALSGVNNRPYQAPPPQSQQSSSQTDPVDYDSSLGSTGSGIDSSTTTGGVVSDSAAGAGTGTGGNNNFVPNFGGMPNLTPGQLVGGVANTVNSVIQTLSNAPVYG